jgi:hypothetical protein
VCLLRGTDWVFKSDRYSFVLIGLTVVRDIRVLENKLFIRLQELGIGICAPCVTRTSIVRLQTVRLPPEGRAPSVT